MTTKAEALQRLELAAWGCQDCALCASREQVVFSRGSVSARLLVVSGSIEPDDDVSGIPVVGRSGEILDSMLKAIGLGARDVYVCTATKCRTPGDRLPTDEELEACSPYLAAQIETVDPALILALGRPAMKALGMGFPERWRGRWARVYGVPALATYHPAFIAANPGAKAVVLEDLAALRREYRKRVTLA